MASVQSCTHTTIQMFDAEEEEKAMLERQNIDDRSVISHVRSIIIVLILSYINLVIYMDFFTENGVMPNLQSDFHLESSGLGLKNIVSICSQVLAHQVFGYLGDRFNRKYIMCAGMSFWAIMNLCITFIPNEYFQLFLEMRRLIGIAKVCCSTMAPTIIADLFVGRQRGCMLSIYYFTEPLGCGLGYIIASTVTRAAGGDWRWAFRVTPGLGLIAVLLFISFVKEPQREIFDRNSNKLPSCKTWMMDMKHLIKNKSFMLSTFGIANVKFVTGAITSWAPSFLMLTGVVTKQKEPCQPDVCDHHDSLIFGIFAVSSSAFGIVAGVKIAEIYKKYDPRGDPKVCAVSLLIGSIFLYLALFLANISFMASYVFIIIVEILLSLNFAIAADIRLYVVSPRRRSTGQAIVIMVSGLLVTAEGSNVIGKISDLIKAGKDDSDLSRFHSLQYALASCPFLLAIGGGLFLATSVFLENDRKCAEMESEVLITTD